MIVTNEDIAKGGIAILPVGWRKYGNSSQAIQALGKEWREQTKDQPIPTGWGLIYSADSERATVSEIVVERRHGAGLLLKAIPGDPEGNIETREVPMDFDVVDLITDEVLAEARAA